jgi:monovalent cation/proton antiporter MnhG/PhaG subunit
MNVIFELVAIVCIIIGTAYSIIGVVGLHRFPDVYTRLHATGKVGVFGVVLLLLAGAFIVPGAWSKIVVLVLILLVVGPVTAHALASAAYRLKVPMVQPHSHSVHLPDSLLATHESVDLHEKRA